MAESSKGLNMRGDFPWSHDWFIGTLSVITVQMGRIRLKRIWLKICCCLGGNGGDGGIGDNGDDSM